MSKSISPSDLVSFISELFEFNDRPGSLVAFPAAKPEWLDGIPSNHDVICVSEHVQSESQDGRVLVGRSFYRAVPFSADFYIAIGKSGVIEAPMLSLQSARFGPFGPSSRSDIEPALIETCLSGARRFACALVPRRFIVGDAFAKVRAWVRASSAAEALRVSIDSGVIDGFGDHMMLMVWHVGQSSKRDKPVWARVQKPDDFDDVIVDWQRSNWRAALFDEYKRIRLSGKCSMPEDFMRDEPDFRVEFRSDDSPVASERLKVCVDGNGGALRLVAQDDGALASLRAAKRMLGTKRDQVSKQRVPTLDFRLRARWLVRQDNGLDKIVDVLESFGFDVEISDDVPGWLQSINNRYRREIAPFEQNIQVDDGWECLHQERGVESALSDLYQNNLKRLDTDLPWPLWKFQERDVARMLCKPNSMYAAFMGAGKASTLDAKILTPSGWVRMGDITIGDHVTGRDGKPHKVVGVYPQGKKEVYRVTFSDGASTECCDEHLWNVMSPQLKNQSKGGYERWQTKSLRQIMDEGLRDRWGNLKNFIPMVEPVEFTPERDLPVDPYLLGLLLGDGYLGKTTPSISTADEAIIKEVARLIPSGMEVVYSSGYDYRLVNYGERVNPLYEHLDDLGVAGKLAQDKSVPERYLYASIEDRLSLLHGLMDSDGTPSRLAATFCSVSKKLAEDMTHLARSLGGTATIKSRQTSYTHNGHKRKGRMSWRVRVRLPEGIPLFRLKRKLDLVEGKGKPDPTRSITSIEAVGEKECQCIQVDADDQLYVTDDFIVTHNTRLSMSYIWMRGGRRNLVVLQSRLIDEFIEEAEKIGFPLEDIHVIEQIEDAEPENLKRLNLISYSKVWKQVGNSVRPLPEDAPKSAKPDACKTIAHVLRKTRFNSLIFDEAHYLKGGPSTMQARYSMLFRSKHVLLMSGTVARNYPRNLYPLMVRAFGSSSTSCQWAYGIPVEHPDKADSCTSGTRVFSDKFVETTYVSSQFSETSEGPKGRELPKVPDDALEDWYSMLEHKVLRRQRKEPEVLRDIPLPEADERDVEFAIDRQHAEFYYWWLENFFEWMETEIAKEESSGSYSMNNGAILAQLQKLQFAATIPQSPKVNEGVPVKWPGGLTTKQEGVVDSVTESVIAGGEKVIVFSKRPELLDLLDEEFYKRGVSSAVFHGGVTISNRNKKLKNFRSQDGPDVLLMSLGSGNTGYNIPEADAVWLCDYDWVPSTMKQAAARMLRAEWLTEERKESGAQPKIRQAVQMGTIDEYMRQLVNLKMDGLDQALDRQNADFDPDKWMTYRDFSVKMFRDLGFEL